MKLKVLIEFKKDGEFGHIAQVGQDPAKPLIWDQTLPNDVKRTLPISLYATTIATISPPPPTTTITAEIPATSNVQSAAGSSTQISSSSSSTSRSLLKDRI
jgi:hypothetical protein